jgi:phosphatidylserine/phosphatidylglycerophosphate/cardiolipin synthase-like enzyme
MSRFMTLMLVSLACNPAPTQEQLDQTRGGRVDYYFNDPGSRLEQVWDPDVVDVMIDMVDNAQVSIEFAVMGFSYAPLAEAFVRAYDRGVRIEMVGDAEHLTNYGYERFRERHIPMTVGNIPHIMHDKFMVVDGRFVFASTANWSQSDLKQNSNNFVVIDSPEVAADFQAEHEQMFNGVFGSNKVEIDNGRVYQVGDTEVEVWFAPNEDVAGRMVELVDAAQESVWFTIFAFTKDQVGSAYIRKQEEFAAAGKLREGDQSVGIWGVIDQSQLHSNGQYHEAFRLLSAGIPMRMDGNDATLQPGDYQAGGGRLHSKTMVIDPDGENPVVISGSFNWSASATQSNDEYLLVFKGKRVAQLYKEYFQYLWANGRQLGPERMGQGDAPLSPGDITFNEIHWYGAHPNDIDGQDEFIELRNHTSRDIVLDMWQISNPDDFIVGFPPGSVVPANGTFTIVDHLLETYQDGAPQDENTAFIDGDLIVNAYNDNRQARLYLKDGALQLFLKDPLGQEMDRAGDGGPAFFGGPVDVLTETRVIDGDEEVYRADVVRSMIRLDGPGEDRSSWSASTVDVGGAWVNPDPFLFDDADEALWSYRDTIRATPGELDPAQP